MNHDYAHCWDYEKGACPENCFRAVLTEDLKNWPHPVTYAKIKGTDACPITNPPPKPTHADRIRAMTDEELAKKMAGLESFALTCGGGWPPEKWLDWLRQEAEPCEPQS